MSLKMASRFLVVFTHLAEIAGFGLDWSEVLEDLKSNQEIGSVAACFLVVSVCIVQFVGSAMIICR
jgi:hypothetical protein